MIDNILFKDKDYKIINYEEKDGKIYFYVKSKIKACKCPTCHMESNIYHGTYTRHIQDTPIHNIETWLNVSTYEFVCKNKDCNTVTFTEELPFARRNKVKTDSLIQLILSVSIFLSSTSASLILSFIGVKVSADAIDDIIKNIKIVDNPDVEEVGIDDVAIRKGQTYATAIYDMKDHHLLALLDGRDADSVKEWLSNHQKIKVVARDRASSYATAISEILPNCMQVADRFHLFENLIRYLKDIFYNEIPEKIFIQDNKIVNEKEIQKVPIELSVNKEILKQLDYDNTPPVDQDGNIIFFDNKRRDLNSKQYKNQTQNRKNKYEMIKKLRERLKYSTCHETKEIAKEFKISSTSLSKYRNMTDIEVENIIARKDYKKRKTMMDDYVNIVYKMIANNVPPEYIIFYLLGKGYTGSISNIKNYIVNITNNNKLNYNYSNILFTKYKYPDNVTIITRYELLKNILTIDVKKRKRI